MCVCRVSLQQVHNIKTHLVQTHTLAIIMSIVKKNEKSIGKFLRSTNRYTLRLNYVVYYVRFFFILFTHPQTKDFFGYFQQSALENAFQIPLRDLLAVVPIACPLPVRKKKWKKKYENENIGGKSVKNKNKNRN